MPHVLLPVQRSGGSLERADVADALLAKESLLSGALEEGRL